MIEFAAFARFCTETGREKERGRGDMAWIQANGVRMDLSLLVFDKDGLMFQSQPFWSQIGDERIRVLKEYLDGDALSEWAAVFGLTLTDGLVTYTDPKGILAVAAPREEMAVTAGFLARHRSLPWSKALELAGEVFRRADAHVDLRLALVPAPGFPAVFRRLREAGIPYAIATSDTKQRVMDSLALFGEAPPEILVVPEMVARGKPAPDMLLLAAELAKVPPERVAMVGDSYVDVEMARHAGAFGIGVPETAEMRAAMVPFASVIVDSLDGIEILNR